MQTLKIKVTETDVTVTEQSGKITAENVNQIQCIFDLPKAFDNLIVRASFNGAFVAVEQGVCFAPPLTEGTCRLGVYGYTIEEDKLKLRISPSPCCFYVYAGSYNSTDVQANHPKPTELEAHYNRIQALIDAGKLQGPPGKDYTLTEADKTEIAGRVPVDAELSADSVNAIQNKAVAAWLDYAKCKGLRIIYDAETAAEYFAGAYKDALQEGEYYLVYIMNTVDLDSFACSSGLYVVTRDFQFEDNLYLPSTETLGEVFAYYEEELENVDDTADRNARYIEILVQEFYDLKDDIGELQNRMNRIENGINSIEAMIDKSGVLA